MDRLTIDEAIEHAREVARVNREDAKYAIENELHDAVIKTCTECAEEHEQLVRWLEELKDYQDLEEQGLLLKLPFPLGTKKLYLIDGYEIDEIDATGITLYKANENAIRPHETVICVDYCDFYYDDFGKTVFLTKEEAEQELKRLESAE